MSGQFGNLGGSSQGTGTAVSQQSATVNFIPSAPATSSPPIVSVYPAGQGLATLNTAYPTSAAVAGPATSSPATSSTLLLYVALIGGAAWLLFRKRGR